VFEEDSNAGKESEIAEQTKPPSKNDNQCLSGILREFEFASSRHWGLFAAAQMLGRFS
jgi:hypothetical protein